MGPLEAGPPQAGFFQVDPLEIPSGKIYFRQIGLAAFMASGMQPGLVPVEDPPPVIFPEFSALGHDGIPIFFQKVIFFLECNSRKKYNSKYVEI
jgi:hypothetical protein